MPNRPGHDGPHRAAAGALQPGDDVPHFELTTLDGEAVRYRDIWQRKNLVLVLASGSTIPYATSVAPYRPELARHHTRLVLTRDGLPGVPSPGVLVADRWGEICFVTAIENGRPAPEELLDWVRFVQSRCPECEGEAR